MAAPLSKATRIRNVVTPIIFILVVFGAYFFLYIDRRERLVTEHHLKLLANAAAYTSNAIDGKVKSIAIAATTGSTDWYEEPDDRQIAQKISLISNLTPTDPVVFHESLLDSLSTSVNVVRFEYQRLIPNIGYERASVTTAIQSEGEDTRLIFLPERKTSWGQVAARSLAAARSRRRSRPSCRSTSSTQWPCSTIEVNSCFKTIGASGEFTA